MVRPPLRRTARPAGGFGRAPDGCLGTRSTTGFLSAWTLRDDRNERWVDGGGWRSAAVGAGYARPPIAIRTWRAVAAVVVVRGRADQASANGMDGMQRPWDPSAAGSDKGRIRT